MLRNISILIFVLLGLCEFLIVLALLAIALFGVVEEPKATELVKELFLIGAVLIVPFLLARWFIKCEICSKSLITFNNFDGRSVSWDDLLISMISKKPIQCPHCRKPNYLRNKKSSI